MNINFMRGQDESLVWISFPIEGSLKQTKDSVEQHLYKHKIKATVSTLKSCEGTSIKLRFPTEVDEVTFMMYMDLLSPKDAQ